MSTMNMENIFQRNYEENFVWIIDNFRFQSRDTLFTKEFQTKSEQDLKWTLEYKLLGEARIRINGSLSLKRSSNLPFGFGANHPFGASTINTEFGGTTRSSLFGSNTQCNTGPFAFGCPHTQKKYLIVNNSVILAQLDEDDQIGQMFLHKINCDLKRECKFDFTGEISRGRSYPYDSLRLCLLVSEDIPTTQLQKGYIHCSSLKVNQFQKSINLASLIQSKSFGSSKFGLGASQTGFGTAQIASDASQKISVFDSYTERLLGGSVRLECLNNSLRCHVSLNTNCLHYLKMSLFNERIEEICIEEKWRFPKCGFSFGGNLSAGCAYFTELFSYENYIDINSDIFVLIEIATSTEEKSFRFIEGPIGSPKLFSENSSKEVHRKEQHYSDKSKNSDHSLMNEIWMAYGEQKLSDLTIRVGSKSFAVHKTILCARSPVFETMLQSDMKEKNLGIVEIKDTTPEIVEKFLIFVYSDKVPDEFNLEEFAQLYSIADKYQVKLLKQKCSEMLDYKLDLNNVYEILSVADLYRDQDLKNSAFNFIRANADAVFKSEEWKQFMMRKMELAGEAMHFCLT